MEHEAAAAAAMKSLKQLADPGTQARLAAKGPI
jgi:hypothetical protein